MTQIYVFPGQGSQSIGMGEGLFEKFPEETQQANQVLGYDIKDICLQGPADKLLHWNRKYLFWDRTDRQ